MKRILSALMLGAGVASGVTAFAHNFGGETVAFYAFDDGEVGTSAVGVPLKNAINDALLPGRVEVAGNGTVTFSDVVPGEYLYTNLEYAAGGPVFSHPKSLYFSRTSGTGSASNRGTVFFDNLMAEAQKLGAFKIEFWYKFDAGSKDDTSGFFDVYGGWSCDDGKGAIVGTNAVLRFLPRSINASLTPTEKPYYYMSTLWRDVSTGQWGSQARFGGYEYPVGTTLLDGKWHQVSFAMPMGGFAANNPFAFGCDMLQTAMEKALDDANVGYRDNPDDTKRFIQLNASGAFCGWVSCVRLSRMPRAVKTAYTQLDWLRPYSVEKPREYLRYRFEEGMAGEPFAASVVTNLAGYNLLNPDIFILPESMMKYGPAVGRVQGDGEIIAYDAEESLTVPVAAADVKKAKVLENAVDKCGRDNKLSVRFVAPTVSEEDDSAIGYGLLTRVGTYPQPLVTDDQTVEFFFKFDYEDWKSRNQGKEKLVSLMWFTVNENLTASDNYLANFGVGLDLANETTPKIGCFGYAGSMKSGTSLKVIDGKWHHVASTLKPAKSENKAVVNLYLDGVRLVTDQEIYYFYNKGNPDFSGNAISGRNIWFARSTAKSKTVSSDQAFNGLIDEIRICKGILQPNEFMLQKNMHGLTVIVR